MRWPLLLAVGAAFGCNSVSSDSDGQVDGLSAEERACLEKRWLMTRVDGIWTCLPYASSIEECEERGGEVVTVDGQYWACYQETSDAGRPCHDWKECFGYCEAPADATEGEKVTGTCSRRTVEECFVPVVDGRVRTVLCL